MEFLTAPWPRVTQALKSAKRRRVAVTPYLGSGAFHLLPLRKKSDVLVVDASEVNVQAGLISPVELQKFLSRGVRCYSLSGLHAKVYRADDVVITGSANASNNSAHALIEAALEVRKAAIIEQFQEWLDSQPLVPITMQRVAYLKKLYKPPKWKKTPVKRWRATSWLTNVSLDDDTEEADEFRVKVAQRNDRKDDDVYVISYAARGRFVKLLSQARAGDEFFVIDRLNKQRPVVSAPLRLIEKPRKDGKFIRVALENAEVPEIPLSRFLTEARKFDRRISEKGNAHRTLSAEAAEALRRLFK